jgi:site-specific DNA-methyltransferase (adenine-specific)
MPESVTDRPTRSHEYVFLLTKQSRYFYDADAIREAHEGPMTARRLAVGIEAQGPKLDARDGNNSGETWYGSGLNPAGRNKRSVWTVATQPYAGAHFATFPPKLIEPCVLAGCPVGGTVLDPFAGAGTTGVVALRRDRSFIGVELNPEYAELARQRIRDDAPLLNTFAEYSASTTTP